MKIGIPTIDGKLVVTGDRCSYLVDKKIGIIARVSKSQLFAEAIIEILNPGFYIANMNSFSGNLFLNIYKTLLTKVPEVLLPPMDDEIKISHQPDSSCIKRGHHIMMVLLAQRMIPEEGNEDVSCTRMPFSIKVTDLGVLKSPNFNKWIYDTLTSREQYLEK